MTNISRTVCAAACIWIWLMPLGSGATLLATMIIRSKQKSMNSMEMSKEPDGESYGSDAKNAAGLAAQSTVLKLNAARLETMTNLAASRAEETSRAAMLNAHSNAGTIERMQLLLSDTEKYKHEAEGYHATVSGLFEELKKVPDFAAHESVALQLNEIVKKQEVVNEELAKAPDKYVTMDVAGLSEKEKRIMEAYNGQKQQMEMVKKLYERQAQHSRLESEGNQEKAMAILNAADEKSNFLDDSGQSVVTMYADAAQSLRAARHEFDAANEELMRARQVGETAPKYDEIMTSIAAR